MVEQLTESLVVLASPPPETVTTGTSGVVAFAATFTVSVSALLLPDPAIDPANVAVGGARLVCVQPVPVNAVAVSPAGSVVIVAVIVPDVAVPLEFVTVTVYVLPVSP